MTPLKQVDTFTPEPTDQALAALENTSWQYLVAALDENKDEPANAGFKTLTVATSTSRGADVRMVVLRRVDAVHKYVWFYTDVRAQKVLQMEEFPNAALLFWDDKLNVQLRLTVETRLHTDDYVADDHWKSLWVGGRKSYLSERKPGSEQPGPYPGFPERMGEKLPTPEESEAGRKNFAVIECRVLTMESLQLSRGGQTRACFRYEPELKMVWLAP